MHRLQVAGVTPARPYYLDLRNPDHTQGRVTVHSGVVSIVANPGFRGMIRHTDVLSLSFFVPDAPPVTSLPSHLEVEMDVRTHRSTTGDLGGAIVIGAVRPTVRVAPDPSGEPGGPWLLVEFGVHPIGTEGCELGYRVSVWA
ncbi:hypothetical protein DJ010_09785 [Nocardioides silvaticus]|uniref:Uncharacterized protein n=1 Tax=Nocardioides silvaticus TaxID=2201891 RepID=A0A316TFT2_9ACTN|nr:hypothetical protein [Nocardioides silvaticus]PWN03383.1 hypothetical protein DJ010_09785 [Nocardioides silvaticus]